MRTRSWTAAVLLSVFSFPVLANEPGVVSPPAKVAATANAPAEPDGLTPLFNGKDLTGWLGHPKLWSVKEGVIRGETTAENKAPGNTFLIYTGEGKDGKEFKDFELRFSVKIQGGNSGVQIRSKRFPVSKEGNEWIVGGYQCEIAGIPGKDGFLYNEKGAKGRGYATKSNYLAWVGDKVEIDAAGVSKATGTLGENAAIAAANRKGEWNDYIVIAKGNHVQIYINGVQTVDVTDNDEKNRPMAGIMALQIHAGPPMVVEFKNLRMKSL